MPAWFTRRLWWRVSLIGALLSTLVTLISGPSMTVDTIYCVFLIPAIVTLHPLMDQPVKPFGPGLRCRRFYIGCALAALAITVQFTVS
jgi:hypothetical protein